MTSVLEDKFLKSNAASEKNCVSIYRTKFKSRENLDWVLFIHYSERVREKVGTKNFSLSEKIFFLKTPGCFQAVF